jgi:hypothetical protein
MRARGHIIQAAGSKGEVTAPAPGRGSQASISVRQQSPVAPVE